MAGETDTSWKGAAKRTRGTYKALGPTALKKAPKPTKIRIHKARAKLAVLNIFTLGLNNIYHLVKHKRYVEQRLADQEKMGQINRIATEWAGPCGLGVKELEDYLQHLILGLRRPEHFVFTNMRIREGWTIFVSRNAEWCVKFGILDEDALE